MRDSSYAIAVDLLKKKFDNSHVIERSHTIFLAPEMEKEMFLGLVSYFLYILLTT